MLVGLWRLMEAYGGLWRLMEAYGISSQETTLPPALKKLLLILRSLEKRTYKVRINLLDCPKSDRA